MKQIKVVAEVRAEITDFTLESVAGYIPLTGGVGIAVDKNLERRTTRVAVKVDLSILLDKIDDVEQLEHLGSIILEKLEKED